MTSQVNQVNIEESQMDEGIATHAMTEIALALAMAFFALMILTLVSMGTGQVTTDQTAEEASPNMDFEVLDLIAPAAEVSETAQDITSDDVLLVHDGTRFYNANLEAMSEAAAQQLSTDAVRVILALPPTLAFEETVRVRGVLGGAPVLVTPLTDDWLTRLAGQP